MDRTYSNHVCGPECSEDPYAQLSESELELLQTPMSDKDLNYTIVVLVQAVAALADRVEALEKAPTTTDETQRIGNYL